MLLIAKKTSATGKGFPSSEAMIPSSFKTSIPISESEHSFGRTAGLAGLRSSPVFYQATFALLVCAVHHQDSGHGALLVPSISVSVSAKVSLAPMRKLVPLSSV